MHKPKRGKEQLACVGAKPSAALGPRFMDCLAGLTGCLSWIVFQVQRNIHKFFIWNIIAMTTITTTTTAIF